MWFSSAVYKEDKVVNKQAENVNSRNLQLCPSSITGESQSEQKALKNFIYGPLKWVFDIPKPTVMQNQTDDKLKNEKGVLKLKLWKNDKTKTKR